VGTYLRVLSLSDRCASARAIARAVQEADDRAQFVIDGEGEPAWTQATLCAGDPEEPFAVVERNPVAGDSLGAAEIAEFLEEMSVAKPARAAEWLKGYLGRVRTVYALQILHGSDADPGPAVIRAALDALCSDVGGIVQADAEGFTNEAGHHILWGFADGASGPSTMAVLNEDGSWTAFRMDLGDTEARRAFCAGQVPPGAQRLHR